MRGDRNQGAARETAIGTRRHRYLPPTTAVERLLQPALDQFRGPAVQLVGPSLDVGEHIGDPGQVVKFAASAVPRRGRIRGVVGTNSRLGGWKDLRDGGLRFRSGPCRSGWRQRHPAARR